MWIVGFSSRNGNIWQVMCPAEAAEPEASPAGDPQSGGGEAVDPVCGMTVNVATAELVSEHAGRKYCFCCAGCQHRFEKEPERYLEATA